MMPVWPALWLAGSALAAKPVAEWKEQPALPAAVSRHRAVIHDNALLVMGGRDRFGKLQGSVFRATLSGGGECGKWSRDRDLPYPVSDHAVCVLNGTVYLSGGLKTVRTGELPADEIWAARPGPDGSVKAWTRAGRLPAAVHGHGLVTVGGRVYCLGGMGTGGYQNVVAASTPGPDGVLGAWTPVSPLPAPVANPAVLALDKYLIVIGGQSPGEGRTLVMPTVYVGPVFPDGTVPTWYLASSKLPGAWLGFGRNQAAAVAWHDSLFCFGGQDALWFLLDTIVTSRFDLKRGELSPWGVVQGADVMPQITTAVVWKDFVYLMGGTVKGAVTPRVFRGHFARLDEETGS